MNSYQIATIKNFIESGAFSEVMDEMEKKCYNTFKLSVDNPEKISDTINMIRGLKNFEATIQSVINELEPDDDIQ